MRSALAGWIAVIGCAGCVPTATLDPCERCPGACDATGTYCVAEKIADVEGPIANLAARGGEAVACLGPRVIDPDLEVQNEASAVRLIRYDGEIHPLAAPFGKGENCAGASYGADGRAFLGVYNGPAQGVYHVVRDRNRAARIAPLPDVRDVAGDGERVIVAAGAPGREVFTGLARVPVTGAEVAAPLGSTGALSRLPTKVVVEPGGRLTWSIASTEEVLTKPSADAGEVDVLLDGRGSFPRASGLRDFAVAGDAVVVVLDAFVLVVPRDRPWAFESIQGLDGEARVAADSEAIYVAWWAEERVERIDRRTGEHSSLGSGIRGGVLALDGATLWIGEARGSRLFRVALPSDADW